MSVSRHRAGATSFCDIKCEDGAARSLHNLSTEAWASTGPASSGLVSWWFGWFGGLVCYKMVEATAAAAGETGGSSVFWYYQPRR